MKNLFITLLCLWCTAHTLEAGNKLTLAEAIKRGLVKAEVQGLGYREGLNVANYGPCIKLVLRNLTGNNLNLQLEPGRMLSPKDPKVQAMVVTESRTFALSPSVRQTYYLNAMCGEKSDRAPGSMDIFTVSNLASSDVQGMASIISRHKYQDYTGQQAMWCITDSLSIDHVDNADTAKTRILQQYISKVTGQVIPEKTRRQMAATKSYVTFNYELDQKSDVKMVLENASGQVVETFYNIPGQALGKYSLSSTIIHRNYGAGIYKVKLFAGSEAILTETLTLQAY